MVSSAWDTERLTLLVYGASVHRYFQVCIYGACICLLTVAVPLTIYSNNHPDHADKKGMCAYLIRTACSSTGIYLVYSFGTTHARRELQASWTCGVAEKKGGQTRKIMVGCWCFALRKLEIDGTSRNAGGYEPQKVTPPEPNAFILCTTHTTTAEQTHIIRIQDIG